MDANCTAMLKAIMIALGRTQVEVTDDDLHQASQYSLLAPSKTGRGEGMIFSITESQIANRKSAIK